MNKTALLIILIHTLFMTVFSDIYFKNSDHELEVIKIKGKEQGLTVLIFGGIHGDEPGGYFSSEFLGNIKLEKGNLIIIPRVNFPGIMLNRREINGDMNRKFTHKELKNDPDREVMELLKKFMGEADVLINQHDARGFHREKKTSKWYGPEWYGQCLIIDTDKFYSKKLKKEIELEKIADNVITTVNGNIPNPDYHFTVWNHHSFKRETRHSNMRKSATGFAMKHFSIPAFGLETSKHLPTLELKVKHQLLVINEIIHAFGLKGTIPAEMNLKTELHWIELLKNKKHRLIVNGNTNIRLAGDDTISIDKIVASNSSGLSANVLQWGNLNDIKDEHRFTGTSKEIRIKKNNQLLDKIFYKGFTRNSIREIHIQVDGVDIKIPNWGVVNLKENSKLRIIHAYPNADHRFSIKGIKISGNHKGVEIDKNDISIPASSDPYKELCTVKITRKGRLAGGFTILLP